MKNTTKATRILLLVIFCILDEVDGGGGTNSASCWMDENDSHSQTKCEAALSDERNQVETFYMTTAASITALISGSISAVSSILIIYLIRRSCIGLSSVYHQIMCGVSIVGVFTSAAFAVGKLPMPKNTIYSHSSWLVGNHTTCTIQGFVLTLFLPLAAMLNTILSEYFLLAISFKKRDAELKKYTKIASILPIIFSIFCLSASFFSSLEGFINPIPFDAWCVAFPYPYYCMDEGEDNDSCLRGNTNSAFVLLNKMLIAQLLIVMTLNIITLVSLMLVIIEVLRQESYINIGEGYGWHTTVGKRR